jgi:hypothetical protein
LSASSATCTLRGVRTGLLTEDRIVIADTARTRRDSVLASTALDAALLVAA